MTKAIKLFKQGKAIDIDTSVFPDGKAKADKDKNCEILFTVKNL